MYGVLPYRSALANVRLIAVQIKPVLCQKALGRRERTVAGNRAVEFWWAVLGSNQ